MIKVKSFVFFENYAEIVFMLKNEHMRAQVLEAVIQYGLYGRDPTFDDETGACDVCFNVIKKRIDVANDKRRRYSQAARTRGTKIKSIKNNEPYANIGNTAFVEDKSTTRIRRTMSAIASAPIKRRDNNGG